MPTLPEWLNPAGVAPQETVHQVDPAGGPSGVGSVTFTSQGQLPTEDPTPDGVATVARHLAQSSPGGN